MPGVESTMNSPVRGFIHMYPHLYLCVYIHIYIYLCVYTHAHTQYVRTSLHIWNGIQYVYVCTDISIDGQTDT